MASAAMLTAQQAADLRDIFSMFDFAGDGRIGAQQLGAILRMLGMNPTPAEVQDMIADVDASGTGKIDEAEFMNMMCASLGDCDNTSEVQAAFAELDTNQDGKLTTSDITAAAAALDENVNAVEAAELVTEADVESSGGVSLTSLSSLMVSN